MIEERRLKEQELYLKLYKQNKAYGKTFHAKNILNYIKNLNINSIADIGCGRGTFPIWCYKNNIKKVIGVDFAADLPKHDKIIFIRSFANILPIINKSIEYITAFDVMEHLIPDDTDVVLNEFKRVATKGFIFSICYRPSGILVEGNNLHPNVHDKDWWIKKLNNYGKVIEHKEYLIVNI
ncbi:MAG: class I SAM-dependent methyltransferase [bacterium]